MHKWLGWALIVVGLAALGSFFALFSAPPLIFGVLILAGAWLAFGGLKTSGLGHDMKALVGWVLLVVGILALGSLFVLFTLPPLGFGLLVLVGGYLAARHSHRR